MLTRNLGSLSCILARDGVAHLSIGLHVAQLIIIHHTQIAVTQGFGDRKRNLCLGSNHLGAHFLCERDKLLLLRDSKCTAFFGFGVCDLEVGLGLVGLQLCTDVFTDVDVSDVDAIAP